MSFSKITIEATVSAPTQKVWTYWTKPEHITKWNFATDTWQCPTAFNDLKVGGKYGARMEAKDGSFGFDFVATYNEVVDQKTLMYTMEDGRTARTTFENLGDKTKVTTVFDAETQNPPEMQKGGWQSILNNFKKYTETH
ncbi:MAG: SRPBCC family protein [Pseudobdellovibrio sp.]